MLQYTTHTSVQPLTYFFTHPSPNHSTHPSIQSSTHPFIKPSTQLSVQPSIHPSTHPFTQLSTDSYIHSSTHPPTQASTYQSIHFFPPTPPSNSPPILTSVSPPIHPSIPPSPLHPTGSHWFSTLNFSSTGTLRWLSQTGPRQPSVPQRVCSNSVWIVQHFGYFSAVDGPCVSWPAVEGVLVYLDDIIMLGQTFQEHPCNLQSVLLWLCESDLHLKPSKCCFFHDQI